MIINYQSTGRHEGKDFLFLDDSVVRESTVLNYCVFKRNSLVDISMVQNTRLRLTNLYNSQVVNCNLTDCHITQCDVAGIVITNLRARDGILTRDTILSLPIFDPRGYRPMAYLHKSGVWRITSGCRDMFIEDAERHWGDRYHHCPDIALRYMEGIKWLKDQPIPAIPEPLVFEQRT